MHSYCFPTRFQRLHTISITGLSNGSVTANTGSAHKDATVTLTVKPDAGYKLYDLTVTDTNGNYIALTDLGSNKYSFKMPAIQVTVSALFMEDCPTEHFIDVNTSEWYHEAVDYVVENGLMSGMTTNTFSPNGTTTRGMLATILYCLEGSPEVEKSSPYTDVAENVWYTDAIIWASDNGIVKGYGDGTFGPNDPITREQTAAMMLRYAQYRGYDVSKTADLSAYTDAGTIRAYAVEALEWANAEALITGRTETTIVPTGTAT